MKAIKMTGNTTKKKTTTIYKEGTLFMVCTHEELLLKGWESDGRMTKGGGGRYKHDDFPEYVITYSMIEESQARILTVLKATDELKWYYVEENEWKWPVAVFLTGEHVTILNNHVCVEGMTPIDGWFICKDCGKDLKEIIV